MKFIELLVLHIVLTLVIIEVVIRSEEVAAELTNTAQTAVSHFNFVFLSFDVDLKLFWTGKIGVAVIAARPWRFRDRSSDGQVNYEIRTRSLTTTRRKRS